MSMERGTRWMWNYITLINDNHVRCDICNSTEIRIHRRTNHLIDHIVYKHKSFYIHEYEKHKQSANLMKFYTIHNNYAKCNLCERVYLHYRTQMSSDLQMHLDSHKVNHSTAYNLRTWLKTYFRITNFNTGSIYYVDARCNTCNNIFRKSNCFILMKHLRDAHEMDVPSNVISEN